MAEELRLAFILLGSLAIGAVILHGVWTVRKAVGEERKRKYVDDVEPQIEENELSEENQALKLQQMEMDFNELQAKSGNKGLPVMNVDVDSIYHKAQENPPEEKAEDVAVSTETLTFEPQNELFQNVGDKTEQPTEFTTNYDDSDDIVRADLRHGEVDPDDLEPKLGNWSDVTDEPAPAKPVFKDISKMDVDESVSFNQTRHADGGSMQSGTPTQSEPKFKTEPSFQATDAPKTEPEPPQEVLMLFVDKSEGAVIEGARLLPLLLTLGFKFGEMEFFHRHELNSGQGEILFSLANMFNPGTFDPDNMEQFSTRGLTIFMTLPNALEPLQTFNMMHNAAKKIAEEFGAKVLDEQRRPLDVSIVRGYVERIRKFKGKS
ncbi:cell division protein ZipA [Psychrosphaera sp. B3R10]|uniref:cell division protein ZipA n=1 Tax=unclassified Psychrosphaera TaxID=2641570 RepID=UPI001C0805A3|nr:MULTISPECIES: cell division protein ZipA [unclassified Psychrosphaera]MBU2881740.1 cell division protein ZipA [Psychrosphaera sp. I2R16]MBU2990175.1 cell division protein ZipA [Psychrosphaera sp. B3R10]MDO6719952.1 cell division protein ZipA [Psychrosphaera sp. 1_MG-2023]